MADDIEQTLREVARVDEDFEGHKLETGDKVEEKLGDAEPDFEGHKFEPRSSTRSSRS